MPLRRRRHDWRISSVSPVQPGLRDHFIHHLVTRRRRGSQRRLAHLVVVVLVRRSLSCWSSPLGWLFCGGCCCCSFCGVATRRKSRTRVSISYTSRMFS